MSMQLHLHTCCGASMLSHVEKQHMLQKQSHVERKHLLMEKQHVAVITSMG